MPNEIRSASESSCTPKSLVVPVMRAMRPSSMSSTTATPMNGAAVVRLAAHGVDDAGPAAEQVGEREQAGQQRDAAPEPASIDGRVAPACNANVRLACASRIPRRVQGTRARTVSPATDLDHPPSPGSFAVGRQEQVDARSELHHAEALAALDTVSPSFTRQTMRRARMPTICRHDDGPAGSIEPDLGPLVQLAGLVLVGRQERAGMILHPASPRPPTGVRFTWTSIGDRNMLMTCHSPFGAPWPG